KLFPEFIDSITNTIEETGKDGYVSVDDNWHTKYGVETELIKGMRFDATFASCFAINTRNNEATVLGIFSKLIAQSFEKYLIVSCCKYLEIIPFCQEKRATPFNL
ncbi:hypothetical protein IID10_21280, partial [candidate division KSB1 bacterium]|nr:hypothetical protein [candidate division KSB1 bacterium]